MDYVIDPFNGHMHHVPANEKEALRKALAARWTQPAGATATQGALADSENAAPVNMPSAKAIDSNM